ncbi:hypothetical protein [Polymorphospora sp. NPDC050346]|uniref:hypothetical protein n=1 Tax=Polymorphospora sp. NPDC050346 TaxID=3155780 RepID=UPI0033C9BC13
MLYLEIAGVTARRRLQVVRADGAGSYTFYSGVLSLIANPSFRGAVRPDDRQPISFFVPDSATFPTDPESIELEMSLRRIRTTGNPNLVTFGPYEERAFIAPDPRGGEHRWLQISLQVPISSVAAVDLNYRVTV